MLGHVELYQVMSCYFIPVRRPETAGTSDEAPQADGDSVHLVPACLRGVVALP